jgi:hypothetical protein
MKPFFALFCIVILIPALALAQPKYQINGVKVIQNGDTMSNPWVGGFNNPVFSPIDLNQDGLMDVFIYDKSAWKALSFINTGSVGHPSFTYAPEYDRMYPTDLRDWAVIRDFNHDGIGDIIALTVNSDMEVYKGYRNGNNLSYLMTYKHLLYPDGNTYTDHIWTFADNMPVLMDIDGDGDLDVLAPDINAVTLDYYQNMAVDSGWSPDSLSFVLNTQCWGHFYEDGGDCNVTLGQICPHKDGATLDTVRDLRHQGGSCFGTHYKRNNNLSSIFVGDIYCNTMKFLENTGDTIVANITAVDTLFPSYDEPINMPLFPAITSIDADNDGFDDIMVAPFATNNNVTSQSIDINVIQYYHNNAGTDTINTYHYEGDTLFNKGVVDVGTESHPVFFDYNNDGLMDIVIGRFGQFVAPGNPALSTPGTSISSLYLYKNIGTDSVPVYQLEDTDWNHLSVYDANGLYNGLYPAFGDLDGDGKPDMVVGNFSGNIAFFHNSGTVSQASYPSMTSPNWFGINVGFDAAPFIYDVNGDGLNDLVIGSSGRQASLLGSHIFYYWNFGTATNPQFSPDSVNEFFGGVQVWDWHLGVVEGFSNPIMRQENGATVLYSGSQRGYIFKYAVNADSLRSGTFALLDSDVLGGVKPGLRCNVSIADINHDGKNDYLTGNIRGGIMLFSDTAWSSYSTTGIPTVAQNSEELRVYPNPAKDKIFCRLSNGSLQLVSAQLYDLLGSSVAATTQTTDNGIALNVSNVSQGIYVIQAVDRSGKTYQQKIAIMK